MLNMAAYHMPVMPQESVAALRLAPASVVVDCTLGGGGHSRAILQELGPAGRLLCLDRDPDALPNAPQDPRVQVVHSRYGELQQVLKDLNIKQVDAIYADLGVSSHQLDTPTRGFSFRFNAPLDMRMNPAEQTATAAQLLNNTAETDLIHLFQRYGELPHTRRLVRRITQLRVNQPFSTTFELNEAVRDLAPGRDPSGWLAQLYQALRIAVNHELADLEQLLQCAEHVLRPGGVLAVLTYHSLEDRLVKHLMLTGNLEGERRTDFFGNPLSPWKPLLRKPKTPTAQEVAANPRARSAKLRAAQLLAPADAQPPHTTAPTT